MDGGRWPWSRQGGGWEKTHVHVTLHFARLESIERGLLVSVVDLLQLEHEPL